VDSRKLRDLRSGMCAYTQFFCECAAADDRAAYDRRRPRSPPAATVRPERTSGIEVSVYPNTNASPIASASVARLLNPRAVPSAIPVIGVLVCLGLLTQREGEVFLRSGALLVLGLLLWGVNLMLTRREAR